MGEGNESSLLHGIAVQVGAGHITDSGRRLRPAEDLGGIQSTGE